MHKFSKLSHDYYLKLTPEAIVLGVISGIVASAISLCHALMGLTNLYLLVAVLGVFLASLIMISGMDKGHLTQVKYGFLVAIAGGVTTFFGSYFGHSGVLTSITICIIIPFIALTTNSTVMIASSVLYIVDMFIIGSGVPGSLEMAFWYGVSFFGGGTAIILLFYWINRLLKTPDVTDEHIPFSRELVFIGWQKNIRFAVLLTSAVLIANIISYAFNLLQGYWIPMTAMLLLKSDYEFSKKRIKHRFIGTLLGSIAAFFIISMVESKIALALMMLPIFFCIVIALAKHYGAYTFFLTVMITVLFNLISPMERHIITEHRLEDTLLGILSVIVVLWLIHPIINKLLKLGPTLNQVVKDWPEL